MARAYSTPSPFYDYPVRTGRLPDRPSRIPIHVAHSKGLERIPKHLVDTIVMTTTGVFTSVGIAIFPQNISYSTVEYHGLRMSRVRVHIAPMDATARGLDTIRGSLTSRLRGAPVPTSTALSPGGIRVEMYMSTSPTEMKRHMTAMATQFVHIFGQEHQRGTTTYRGRDIVPTFYFAGYIDSLHIYVMCYDEPPKTTLRHVFDSGVKITPDLWHELYRVLLILAYSGFWYYGTFDTLTFTIDAYKRPRAVFIPRTGLIEIPPRHHARLIAELDSDETTLSKAVIDSGMVDWIQQLSRRHDMRNPLEFLYYTIGTVSDPTRDMKRFAMNTWPITNGGMLNGSPTPNNSKESRARSAINTILKTYSIPNTAVTPVGKGVYGTAYRVSMNSTIATALSGLSKSMSHRTMIQVPKARGSVILKFERLTSRRPYQLGNVVREARTHATVSQSVVTHGRQKFKGVDVAPRLFFSGIYAGYAITCMEYLEGALLSEYIIKGTLTKKIFSCIEYMLETLLRIGVVHGDMHPKNVIVTPEGRVKCIDFGFAFELPQSVHQRAVEVLDKTGSIERAWTESGLQEIVNARYLHQNYYHSNLKLLQYTAALVNR
jgi:tRNA A-37 threonylcarbamoyl transferase component Bud32